MVRGAKLDKDEKGEKVNETHYKQLDGNLIYTTTTRPSTMYVVSLLSRFMSNPTESHLQVAKRALRYLQGTVHLGIMYKKGGNEDLLG